MCIHSHNLPLPMVHSGQATACQGHSAAKRRSFLCPSVCFLMSTAILSNSPGALGSLPICLFPPSWFLPPTAQDQPNSWWGANSQDPGPSPGPMENAECLEDSALEAFRTLPDSHKMLPRGLQALPRAPKMLADRSKSHQEASKWPPGGLQEVSGPQNQGF